MPTIHSSGDVEFVRLKELEPAERAAFDAWLRGAQCPVVEGEDRLGLAFALDYEQFTSEQRSGQHRKWGCPPDQLTWYQLPAAG